ncbi:TPA: acyltransferase family protein [Citrobacter braakii]
MNITLNNNKIKFFDIIRVISTFFIIIYHYFYYMNPLSGKYEIIKYLGEGFGEIGVSFFLILSGALSYISLRKYPTIKFYKKRALSILIPYNVSYMVIGIVLVFLSFVLNLKSPPYPFVILSKQTEFSFFPFIYSFFGIDNYITAFNELFNLKSYFFVGEWFIGTILLLYITAPLLFNLINKKHFETLLCSLIISICSFFLLRDHVQHPYWFFTSRLFEFTFGMFFMKNIEIISRNVVIKNTSFIIVILATGFSITDKSIGSLLLFQKYPTEMVYYACLFLTTFYLIGNLRLKEGTGRVIDKISTQSYAIMLVQHVIIYTIVYNTEIESLSLLGVFSIFLSTIFIMYVISRKITYISRSIEGYFHKNT